MEIILFPLDKGICSGNRKTHESLDFFTCLKDSGIRRVCCFPLEFRIPRQVGKKTKGNILGGLLIFES